MSVLWGLQVCLGSQSPSLRGSGEGTGQGREDLEEHQSQSPVALSTRLGSGGSWNAPWRFCPPAAQGPVHRCGLGCRWRVACLSCAHRAPFPAQCSSVCVQWMVQMFAEGMRGTEWNCPAELIFLQYSENLKISALL